MKTMQTVLVYSSAVTLFATVLYCVYGQIFFGTEPSLGEVLLMGASATIVIGNALGELLVGYMTQQGYVS